MGRKRVSGNKLEELMREAGVDADTAEKLRAANDTKPERRPRGFGSATQDLTPVGEF